MASRRTNLNGIQEKGRDTRYRHPCPLLFVKGFERIDYQRLPAPRSAPPPPPGPVPGGLFPLSALHGRTPSATNREATLAQALRRMQATRPVGFSVRPFSLLRPVVRRVSRRVLHPDLVAKDQFPAVPPLQAQQAHADQAQDERKERASSRKGIPPVVQGKVDDVEQHQPEADDQMRRRGIPSRRRLFLDGKEVRQARQHGPQVAEQAQRDAPERHSVPEGIVYHHVEPIVNEGSRVETDWDAHGHDMNGMAGDLQATLHRPPSLAVLDVMVTPRLLPESTSTCPQPVPLAIHVVF